jgi:transcriptional regulator with XRE-family HTH domain
MTDIELGDNIRKIRELKGFSQQFLGDELNISQKQVSRIETGKTSASFFIINRVCQVLEVDLKALLNFDDQYVFNNNNNHQNGGEFIAYNNTDIERLEKLYERLLKEKDMIIKDLKSNKT